MRPAQEKRQQSKKNSAKIYFSGIGSKIYQAQRHGLELCCCCSYLISYFRKASLPILVYLESALPDEIKWYKVLMQIDFFPIFLAEFQNAKNAFSWNISSGSFAVAGKNPTQQLSGINNVWSCKLTQKTVEKNLIKIYKKKLYRSFVKNVD